jgi:hypothetical protein
LMVSPTVAQVGSLCSTETIPGGRMNDGVRPAVEDRMMHQTSGVRMSR